MTTIGMEIQFDPPNRTFMAGAVIKGNVVLQFNETVTARSMLLELKGESRNGWVNKTSDKIYESLEIHLQASLPLLHTVTQIPSGTHALPFSLPLPQEAPSSFEGEFGHVRYTAKALFAFSSPSSNKQEETASELMFNVIARLNLYHYPVTRHPVEALDATDFSCCCVPLGTVSATVSIPKNGFLPDQMINVSAEIHNGSRKRIERSCITLIQHAKFTAMSRYESAEDCKEMYYVIASVSKGTIHPRRTMRIQNEILHVPQVIPTFIGTIINISYILRFEAEPGIEIEIPITIGTMNYEENT